MARSTTEVEAANGALGLIGVAPIASLEQEGSAALAVRGAFADVRDALLRLYDWNFAGGRVSPSREPVNDAGPLPHRFRLPEDCLMVRGVDGASADDWALENASPSPNVDIGIITMLVTRIEAPVIHYTRRVENIALWDALFLEQFQMRLGARLAPLLTGDNTRAVQLGNQAELALRAAKRRDGREKARATLPEESAYLTARRGGWW